MRIVSWLKLIGKLMAADAVSFSSFQSIENILRNSKSSHVQAAGKESIVQTILTLHKVYLFGNYFA